MGGTGDHQAEADTGRDLNRSVYGLKVGVEGHSVSPCWTRDKERETSGWVW